MIPEFSAYLSSLSALLGQRGPRVFVYDARLALPAPASQRRMKAEWLKLNAAEVRRSTLGLAFVLSSPLVRGALTAIPWLQPLPCPHLVTANVEEAFRWARHKLGEATRRGAGLAR